MNIWIMRTEKEKEKKLTYTTVFEYYTLLVSCFFFVALK